MLREINNASELRDARTNRWKPEYGEGIGFENYQVVIGIAVFCACVLLGSIINLTLLGLLSGFVAGIMAARIPNHINTHHRHPWRYLQDKVKQVAQFTLVVNDRRVARPAVLRERYDIPVTDIGELGDDHD